MVGVWDGMIAHSQLNYRRNYRQAPLRVCWPAHEAAVYASYAMPTGRTMQRVDSGCQLPGGSLGCGTNRSMSVAGTEPPCGSLAQRVANASARMAGGER